MFKVDPNVPTEKIELSRTYIESIISQRDLMKHYMMELSVDFERHLDTNLHFRSPLRKDNHPTCSLYTKNNKIYIKDWSGHFHGDVYNLVCYLNNLP